MTKRPKTTIAEHRGDTSHFVDAEITDDGDLRVVRNTFGPGDYETEVIVSVAKNDKDQLLLALLEQAYAGNTDALEDLEKLAAAKGIATSRFRWP